MSKAKNPAPIPPDRRPELVVERSEARAKIEFQIGKGNDLLNRKFASEDEFEVSKQEYFRWEEYNTELLKKLFSTDQFAKEFRSYGFGATCRTLHEKVQAYTKDLTYHINRLVSIQDRLELIDEDPFITRSFVVSEAKTSPVSHKVFIVHGHDNLAKQTAARFVEKFGLEAIILHEQRDSGRTIMEKVEDFSDVGFAIILHSSDDVGNSKAEHAKGELLRGRSRQNVVFEHGFFVGKLGRKNVVALLKGEVEIPSDLHGVVYTPMDEHDAWMTKIAKEMKAAGLAVDLNKL